MVSIIGTRDGIQIAERYRAVSGPSGREIPYAGRFRVAQYTRRSAGIRHGLAGRTEFQQTWIPYGLPGGIPSRHHADPGGGLNNRVNNGQKHRFDRHDDLSTVLREWTRVISSRHANAS
jgi:hypothetical protein